ncbi:MAG: YdcH family protein [Parasphingopyxis sp.]|uniref:YdcH family protein n=1 Tax=Parasphingopyxis sp. TaxID=1920299 RepID=UPI003F9F47B5
MRRRFDSLIARHRELDARIDGERFTPEQASEIGRLKKIRLAIRDEIQALDRGSARPAG